MRTACSSAPASFSLCHLSKITKASQGYIYWLWKMEKELQNSRKAGGNERWAPTWKAASTEGTRKRAWCENLALEVVGWSPWYPIIPGLTADAAHSSMSTWRGWQTSAGDKEDVKSKRAPSLVIRDGVSPWSSSCWRHWGKTRRFIYSEAFLGCCKQLCLLTGRSVCLPGANE